MYVIDPDTTPADTGTPDPAAAAAEAPTPEADPAEGMLGAITADLPEGAESAADAPTDLVPGTNEAAEAARAAEEAPKPDAKPDDAKPKDPAAATAEADAAIAAEAKALGLKDKATERFTSMAKEIRELAPLRDAMKAAGIEDVAQLPVLAKRAKDGDDLVEMVSSTGCTADDFTRVLDYMGTITKGRQGDRAAVEAAFKVVGEEYAAIAKALGKEIPGIHDPLADHADLRAQIEGGDITRAAALEVVQARNLAAAQAHQRQATEQQGRAQQEQQQAVAAGIGALKAWEAPKLADPAYAAIRPALNAKVVEIREKYPPSLWAEATDLAYQALAAEAKAATPPPAAPRQPTPGPVRPGGPRPAMMPTTDDPLEAMMQGIAAATP